MKIRILTPLLFLAIANMAFAGNYILTIGDESYDVALDEEISIKLGDNHIAVRLEQKDFFIYKTDSFSFEHPRQYSPSKSDLGDGVFQTAMMTPLGSIVLIQEYHNLNPSNLIDLMVDEVTKEEREYGYEIESSQKSITLSDGNVLNGKVVTSKYKSSDIKRFFYAYGIKDSGLFIMTQIDYDVEPSAEGVIEEIINSLKVTME